MKYLKYLLFFVFISLSYNYVYALETVTVYTTPSKSSGSGKILWYNLATPTTQSLGTVQSTASYGFEFFFEKPSQVGKVYKVQLNFNDYDYLKGNKSDYVKVVNYNGTSPLNECAILSYAIANQGGSNNQAKTVYFTYTCSSSGNGIVVTIQDQDDLTRISTIDWRLNSVQWETLDDNNASIIIANASQNTQNIINNQNSNTQNIISNQNTNTQNIIAGQSSQTDRIIDNQNSIAEQQEQQQQVCNIIDKTSGTNGYLNSNGTVDTSETYVVTDYISVTQETKIKVVATNNNGRYCAYSSSKSYLTCYNNSNLVLNSYLTLPSNARYVRFTISKSTNVPQFNVCNNGNQAITDALTDDDIGGSASDMGDFLNGFDTNTFGLTSIITAPLNLIQSLLSSTCSDLELPLPYLNNKKLTLPCMTTIYQNTFGSLFTMYQTITFGIIAYWVCVRIFNQVKDFKNPEHDEIEVVDL